MVKPGTDFGPGQLISSARSLGADDAALIPSSQIAVDGQLALQCVDPGCPNYGLSYSCPPYVEGPGYFKDLLRNLPLALVVRLIVPAESLLSWERIEVGRILHELVAHLELEARDLGFDQAQAFAGDSCKTLFCQEHLNCRRIAGDGPCRHPEIARPSMSGFGVDVFNMIQSCEWDVDLDLDPETGIQLAWVAGLVLLG